MINSNAEKARLGISVTLVAAGMFFLGIVSNLALIAIAFYIFIREENVWLRKMALSALILILIYAAVNLLMSTATGFFSFFINDVGILTAPLRVIYRFISSISGILVLAEKVLLIVFGFLALSYKEIRIGFINNLYSRFMA